MASSITIITIRRAHVYTVYHIFVWSLALCGGGSSNSNNNNIAARRTATTAANSERQWRKNWANEPTNKLLCFVSVFSLHVHLVLRHALSSLDARARVCVCVCIWNRFKLKSQENNVYLHYYTHTHTHGRGREERARDRLVIFRSGVQKHKFHARNWNFTKRLSFGGFMHFKQM